MNFVARLDSALNQNKLCVGIDPHLANLRSWGHAADYSGLVEFAARLLQATQGLSQLVKFQVSLFEAFGIEGMRALSHAQKQAREMGFLVIADAKRGDIGTSMDGYQRAWLEPGADFESDALTVNSYLGISTLEPTLNIASANGKGVFALVATSNPEAQSLQTPEFVTTILEQSIELSERHQRALGVVIGATVDQQRLGIQAVLSQTQVPILAPGFGAQGVSYQQHRSVFDSPRLLVASSRDIADTEPQLLRARIEQVSETLK